MSSKKDQIIKFEGFKDVNHSITSDKNTPGLLIIYILLHVTCEH